eukprot:scaffold1127_cov133-Skeletonema_marinoi.AAC.7
MSNNSENSEFRRIKENDPHTTSLICEITNFENMTNEEWEELGRDISNNTRLEYLELGSTALNDRNMSLLCRGLTRSASIKNVALYDNGLSVAGVLSMVPFLQNANNLQELDLGDNNIKPEGFNVLCRSLRDSPIESLSCQKCCIESIDVDNDYFPRHLMHLDLGNNNISIDGCHGIAKLLQGKNTALSSLYLTMNKIDDDGAGILADALRNNTSLTTLVLKYNMMTIEGAKLFLQLVNDVSSIKATLQSNHTLQRITADYGGDDQDLNERIQRHIDNALKINALYATSSWSLPEEACKEKVILTQLHSETRAKLAALQGVNHSLYSEINSLHLPEVLALVGRRHGQGELYVALRSSIAGVISTVNKKQCLQQQRAYFRAKIAEYRAKAEAVEAEISTIEAAEGRVVDIENESYSNKRRRA